MRTSALTLPHCDKPSRPTKQSDAIVFAHIQTIFRNFAYAYAAHGKGKAALPPSQRGHGSPEGGMNTGTTRKQPHAMTTEIRKATRSDLARAWQIISDAKRLMADRGSSQWTEEYPAKATIAADIDSGQACVACDGGGRAVAYAVMTGEPEGAYAEIDGRWLTHGPYLTVHRLAVAEGWRGRGLARAMMERAESEALRCGAVSVRVDTNHDNAPMLAVISALGYSRCGTVSYGPRGERIAFEKPIAGPGCPARGCSGQQTPAGGTDNGGDRKAAKTEFEKMRSGETFSLYDAEVLASLSHAKELCRRLQTMTINDDDYRAVIEELIPGLPKSSTVCPPFHCDHGNGIIMGENVFVNYDCVMLDSGYIRIGDNAKIGPGCHIYTPHHPTGYAERREKKEAAYAVTIGEDTWLGGHVTICPGANIGARCIIAAGSVVTGDIPADSMAAGNPARVKKSLG